MIDTNDPLFIDLTPGLISMGSFADTDHPLSLGYGAVVLTDYPNSSGEVLPKAIFAGMYESDCYGLMQTFEQSKHYLIRICGYADGEQISFPRFVGLLVHETSHMVDAMFAKANVRNVDTEIRAYMLDYFVEKALYSMGF